MTTTRRTKSTRTPAAQKVLRELEAELAASGQRAGSELSWDATERTVVELVLDAVDRKQDTVADYAQAEDAKMRLKLTAELRLTDQAIARLLKQVKTDVPQPMSITSLKASRASRARWDKVSGTG